ncbi:AtzE family amidohydrolase [Sphingomonas sp. CFBP 13728]|uniref:AtzE family amidohydrolase n=1 Tax=Sphingomonas sp. CFBP 13728 TaxID=2775294 RepID=UPI001784C4C1|nr:AtzE family amidohydrolase [Sphingomonas sp. CFBP 13728]MBD8617304.1 AtzE family amidohydrolase [Sphingomonas sp. CFBP 13728]
MIGAVTIARDVRAGRITASAVIERCLANLESKDRRLGAVTRVLHDRARQEARQIDDEVAAGRDPGPLAGVPYGVKDLFDVAGLPTTAGSTIYADAEPARADAEAIRRLREAGAVLVATLNMDEFAYGFATINARHGTTRNPHDLDRLAGGSSGGSAAVVAAGLLPFALGSDTNGSIRVPASLTGVYGLKPTHGDLPMGGVFPFAESFDDIGPFTTSVADLRRVWEVLRGSAPADDPDQEFRVGQLGGRFLQNADPDQLAAISEIAPDARVVDLPDIARARSAAFLITAYEGGTLHRAALAKVAMAFDPATRDRLLAGALIPRALCDAAQDFRRSFEAMIVDLVSEHDVLLAPAAPCVAPLVADPRITIDGMLKPARSDLGIHTQPISFTGLPSLSVPLRRPGRLPLGLQLIGRPNGESTLFRFAAMLEDRGVIGVSPPPGVWGKDA